jgi:hypothetical protein
MSTTATKTAEARQISMLEHPALANTLVNRFNGFTSIVEPKGDKLGKRWAYITFRKPMKMRKFHRTLKNALDKKLANPFLNNVFEVGKIKLDLNAIWENMVKIKADKVGEKGEIGFVPNKTRNNGILNYLDSRVVCHKIKEEIETFYLNYIVAEYVGETVYVDSDNKPIDYADVAEYHQTKSTASKQKEADKHGLEISNDVQIRQMKFENITKLSIFGTDFVPTESATVIVDTKSPVSVAAKPAVKIAVE